ncbi:MAG TPA: asparagine synthase (glutamine-hydrolyzing) [Sphingomicrobium sp.]|jgi:asparagine synthase (glutamine-hydrolysing)|nr:asparagine synthase (glutamine-hydrolyzing) [Sphingomicrobium sp.]
MCGLFAAIGHELSEPRLEEVFRVLHHRGPDGRGSYADSAAMVTFVHTRLAVIDLETGAQPLESDDGNIVLAANGEIYDFERIRASLEAKGCHFRTGSDSEVIIHLYREFGLGCFEQLRGEFAFLLYDRARRLVIAARDRFGIKPLYFSRQPGGAYVFASEMKAIFASGLVVPKLNAAGFDPLLDQDPEKPRLPFENIEHVPPATYIAIDLESGKATSARYWSDELPSEIVEPVKEPADEAASDAARSVLDSVEEAVRLRLRADVPVGLYLSGGIDSTVVAALMKRNLNSRPHSFSISFEGSERSEGEVARRAAEYVGTEHHDLTVTKKMLWDNLDRALWFSELPFVTLAPVGKFLLSEEAKKFVTVVLTGEGADEVFLGYRSFFQKAIRDTRADDSSKAASIQSRRLKLGALSAGLSLRIFHKSQRARLRSQRARAALPSQATKPVINAVQEARLAAMPFDILCYLGDREEMAHSLEARLPFLDHHLYDMAKSIPVDLKIRGGVEKAVLRDAMKGIIPDDFRLRRKRGFMLTSEAVDLFGADRKAVDGLRRHLSRQAFEHAGIFSYRAYLAAKFFAKLPPRTRRLKRLRRNANKVIMYMMQAHMLNDMFVLAPPWGKPQPATASPAPCTNRPSS